MKAEQTKALTVTILSFLHVIITLIKLHNRVDMALLVFTAHNKEQHISNNSSIVLLTSLEGRDVISKQCEDRQQTVINIKSGSKHADSALVC